MCPRRRPNAICVLTGGTELPPLEFVCWRLDLNVYAIPGQFETYFACTGSSAAVRFSRKPAGRGWPDCCHPGQWSMNARTDCRRSGRHRSQRNEHRSRGHRAARVRQ
jgi:hypothetical protein